MAPAADWTDDLQSFELAAIKPFYGESAAARNAAAQLAEDHTYRRTATRRETLRLLHVANAAKCVDHLPAPGESVHIVMRGNFHGWSLVPAILRLAAPAIVTWLGVCTLGFNHANAVELIHLLDSRQVSACWFICSNYFRSTSGDEFGFLHQALIARGHRVAALRSHAKLLLFEMSDGRQLAIESSANLRSCRNIEQMAITHDAGLVAFHRGWMGELLQEAGA